MAHTNFSQSGRYYQSANADAQTVKNEFLVRLHEYDIIMSDLRRNPTKGSMQHYLLLGRRGSGKSTLLRRIQVEIESDEQLQAAYIPINLAEEQANIYRLFDLLHEILEELEEKGITVRKPEEDDDCNRYTRDLFAAIHEAIAQSGKKVLLLLDNIDRIFVNLKEDSALVREMLLNFDDIKIIGGSTVMTEHFWSYDEPFYNFFRVLELKPLTSEEIKTLLLSWSEKDGYGELKNFVEHRQGQLETVRILTDGLPRTLQFFVNILINRAHDSGYEYLKQIMDIVTPLYQERLNNLPSAQRKIVLQLAFLWEASGTKEIAAATHMENNTVSAQLKQLIEKGIAEKLSTNTKNHLYRLSERFFNLWLIFTQGNPKEKRRAKYLTIFMENFYDGDGLRSVAAEHLKLLQDNKLTPNKAALLTKALAQSRYIDSDTRDRMITHTMRLTGMAYDMRAQMPQRIADLKNEIHILIERKEYTKAIKLAESIEQEDGIREYLIASIYDAFGDTEQAIAFYTTAGEKGEIDALFNLGILYTEKKNFELAEKYYLLAIEKGDSEAIFNLASLYEDLKKYELSERYYLLAIEKGDTKSLLNIGNVYLEKKNYELAERYYLLSIEHGDNQALLATGDLYETIEKLELAEKYYLLALKKGYKNALVRLGFLYGEQEKYEQAEKCFLEAIEEGFSNASYGLGLSYFMQEKHDKSEKYFLQALKQKNNKSANFLGLIYQKKKKNEIAEKYFLLAIENGTIEAYYYLGELYASQKKYANAEELFLKAIELGDIDAYYGLASLYHNQQNYALAEKYYLLAIEKDGVDALWSIGFLYGELKKYDLAEKYFALAIEKGDKDAEPYLAMTYYYQGTNKDRALELVNKAEESEERSTVSIILNAWHGNINEAAARLQKLIKDKDYHDIDEVLEHLLYHYQTNLVSSLFADAEHGEALRERFQPLYYAASVLVGKDANIALKIPPEIQETVDAILKNVKEKQEFYYGVKKG